MYGNNVVNTVYSKELKKHVCVHCGNSNLKTVYIITGHDHTDDSVTVCNCGKGENFEDVYQKNRWAISFKE